MTEWILRQVRVADSTPLTDIAMTAGRITAIAPALTLTAANEWDVGGRVVLPGLVDAHTHLDKSYFPLHNQSGTLIEAIEVWRAHKRSRTKEQIQATVRRALQTAVANGVTAMRSHVDVEATSDLATIETILALRDEWRQMIDLQLVALGYPSGSTEQRAAMQSALAMGLDYVGGVPALTPDPLAEIDAAFALANTFGKPIDLHVDETEDPQMLSLEALAEKTMAHGMQGQVTAGHCCSLAFADQATAERVMDKVAQAQLHIITLPSCNLVLMGRNQHPTPRGVTRVKELLARGINVSAASDNVSDPFNPFGSYDLLQIANLNAHVAHLSGEAEIQQSLQMVTHNPAQALGLADYGIGVGKRADLVVVDTTSCLEAVTTIPPRLATFKNGRLLVQTYTERHWHLPPTQSRSDG
jgi:cytosine deaminase